MNTPLAASDKAIADLVARASLALADAKRELANLRAADIDDNAEVLVDTVDYLQVRVDALNAAYAATGAQARLTAQRIRQEQK